MAKKHIADRHTSIDDLIEISNEKLDQIVDVLVSEEMNAWSPEKRLGYNAAGDLVRIRMYTAKGAKFERLVSDPDVADVEVTREVTYSKYEPKYD